MKSHWKELDKKKPEISDFQNGEVVTRLIHKTCAKGCCSEGKIIFGVKPRNPKQSFISQDCSGKNKYSRWAQELLEKYI